jgi:predicted peptidase
MKKNIIWLLGAVTFVIACTSMNTLKPSSNRMEEFHLSTSISGPLDINFLLYFPKDYNPDKKWPLLIFLHGKGERGDDLEKVKIHGPAKLIKEGRDFPFIIAAPQCPDSSWWSTVVLDRWLSYLLTRLPVDQTRIYLTGLSMGGFGTWAWAMERPDRFAAIAPICGWGIVNRAFLMPWIRLSPCSAHRK